MTYFKSNTARLNTSIRKRNCQLHSMRGLDHGLQGDPHSQQHSSSAARPMRSMNHAQVLKQKQKGEATSNQVVVAQTPDVIVKQSYPAPPPPPPEFEMPFKAPVTHGFDVDESDSDDDTAYVELPEDNPESLQEQATKHVQKKRYRDFRTRCDRTDAS